MNRPIYAGFVILEVSKLLMYKFFYEHLIPFYSRENVRLLYTDTDSFMLSIKTQDLHRDFFVNRDLYDLSNFPVDHPFYTSENKKVVGKFKCETADKHPKQLVALRSKMYSLYVSADEKPKLTVKGVKRYFVNKNVKHEHYVNCLETGIGTSASFNMIRSRKHVLQTVNLTKSCLSCMDDKRYLLNDGIRSLAYGHYKIKSGEAANM